ncbi:MAG: c-type cytochrome [Myxococcota bacterium]
MSSRKLAVMFVLALASACGRPEPVECNNVSSDVTYQGQVKAILDAHCVSCHAADKSGPARQGAPADVNLDTYAAAKEHANTSAETTEKGEMPPAMSNDSMSDEDRCVLRGWINGGTRE